LAERAWSRSEMRHDMTMEAIRISQARAALSELAGPGGGGRSRKGGAAVRPGVAGPAGVSPSVPPQPTSSDVRDASDVNSWGVTGGYGGPSQPGRPGHGATPPGGRGRGAPKSSGAHGAPPGGGAGRARSGDRKSTRLNSSHVKISYAVFCLKKKRRT